MSEIVKPVKYDRITECLVMDNGEYIGLNIDGDSDRCHLMGELLAIEINRDTKPIIDDFLASVRERVFEHGDLFSYGYKEAVDEVYAEMFGGEENDG